jgi:hypothetical protein
MSPPPRKAKGGALPDADVDGADGPAAAEGDAGPGASAPILAPPHAVQAWQRHEPMTPARAVRNAVLTISLVLLGVACIVAFYSAMSIVEVWFEHQYQPIVQFVVAAAIIALCATVVRRALRKHG